MQLDKMHNFLKAQTLGLLDLESRAKVTVDKVERGLICRSMHRLAQSIAKLRDDIDMEIESRR